jgi:transcriptional regulator with XRE-family HTH domain
MPSRSFPKNSVVSRRLRQERQRQGIAQDRLGVLAGLEESAASARMSRYESGIHEPPFEFIKSVAKVLGILPAFFYCEDDNLADIIRIYSISSEAQRVILHKVVMKSVES